MAKFKVHLQRFIEQTVTVEIEADDIEAAVEAAEAQVGDEDLAWARGGDDIYGAAAEIGRPAYAASSLDNDDEWERL